MSRASKPLHIDVVADIVCPWCYLGWRRLKKALEMSPGVKAEIAWKAYQLSPDMPAAGVDYKKHMASKFDPEKMKAAQARIRELGAEEGIDFRFDLIRKAPNTNAAHRLIRWAANEGKLDAVAEGVMHAYFTEGRFVGDESELAKIGAAAGMNASEILEKFKTGVDRDIVSAEHAAAQDEGVQGVPFYRIGPEKRVEGSWPAEDLAQEIAASVK